MMGKRSSFKRAKGDFYKTPVDPVRPLLKFLPAGARYVEPCAGDGLLIRHLHSFGYKCVAASDLNPKHPQIMPADARVIKFPGATLAITNPPWTRAILHPIIIALSDQMPTWLLFDADWMHTRQAAPYLKRCAIIVSVGRVKWFPRSKHVGKDNCAWYLFEGSERATRFIPREGV